MMQVDKPVVLYVTFPDRETALKLSGELVAARLAACVNVLGDMTSIYNWEGRLETAREVAALVKTRAALCEQVTGYIAERHAYDVPAMVALQVTGGHGPFLEWIMSETGAPDSASDAP